MIIFGSFLPSLFWLVRTTKVYSGADIVMESITLRTQQEAAQVEAPGS
jgi:hypothetical protein